MIIVDRLLQWVIINNDRFKTKTEVSSQKEEKGVCYSAVAHRRILDEWEEGWFWFLNANVVFRWKEGMRQREAEHRQRGDRYSYTMEEGREEDR